MNYGDPITGKPLRGPGQSGVKPWDAKHKKKPRAHVPVPRHLYYRVLLLTRNVTNDIHVWKSQTMRHPVHSAEQCVGQQKKERHSCFLVITPESSSLIITVTTITIIVPGACRAPQVQITQRISVVHCAQAPEL